MRIFRGLRGWRHADLGRDVAAGLTLAAIAIPEQMATARLGGFAPETGFIAFVAATTAFAVFGSSRHLSAGVDSTIMPIFAGSLALVATSGSTHYGELAAALALIVGVLVTAAGLLRLGWVADLLSVPVTAGFLAGIAVHIVVSQLPGLLGVPEGTGTILERVTVAAAGNVNLASLMLGAGVFVAVVLGERLNPRIPAALIALTAATLAVWSLDLQDYGVAVLGAVEGPRFSIALPAVTWSDLRALAPLGALIAMIVLVQTAATARSFPSAPEQPDVARDFIGVGAGSIAAGMVGAFPVNASPPRTAIVSETGGRSQLAGLLAAAVVLLLVLFGASLLTEIPQAGLAGILLYVAIRILRWQTFLGTLRQAPAEFALAVVTAAAIVALPIESGVAMGIGLSLLHGLWSSTQAEAVELERMPGTSIWWPRDGGPAGEKMEAVLVVAFQAPLSFVNADRFSRKLRAMIAARGAGLQLVVLEASSVADIDYTAAAMLRAIIDDCRSAGLRLTMARLESVRAQAALRRLGIAARLGADGIFHSVANAVDAWQADKDAGRAP